MKMFYKTKIFIVNPTKLILLLKFLHFLSVKTIFV